MVRFGLLSLARSRCPVQLASSSTEKHFSRGGQDLAQVLVVPDIHGDFDAALQALQVSGILEGGALALKPGDVALWMCI